MAARPRPHNPIRFQGSTTVANVLAPRSTAENPRAPRPASRPIASAPTSSFASSGGLPATGNNRSSPKKTTKVRYDAAAATIAGATACEAESSWYGTSSENTAPVAGALKIAATPAAAPAVSSTRWSPSVNKRGNRRRMNAPIDEPR